VGPALGLGFQCLDDHSLDFVVGDRSRSAHARLVIQTRDALLDEPFPPFADGVLFASKLTRDLPVRRAIGAGEHDARTESDVAVHTRARSEAQQLAPLVIIKNESNLRTSKSWH
jgi:hypothetical protein